MIFTNFREIDTAGRIVISKDIRDHLRIHPGDVLYINCDDEAITIKKAEPKCIICNSDQDIVTFRGKDVCRKCIKELNSL